MIIKIILCKSNYLIFILSFFLISCWNKSQNEFIYFDESCFPKAIPLRGEKLNLEHLQNPRGVFINDDYLFVSQTNQDLLINVYDRNSKKLIKQIGKNGVGPGEISHVKSMDDLENPNELWVYDAQYKSFNLFNLSDESVVAEKAFNRNEAFFFIGAMALVSENSVWAIMMDKETQYFVLGFNNDTISSFGSWYKYDQRPDIPASTISSMHQGQMDVNKKRKIGIRAGLFRDYIDIVDISKEQVTTMIGPVNHMTKYSVEYSQGYPMPQIDIEDAKTHYYDVFAGENSFFLLYFGGKINQLGNTDNPSRVFELDYSGKIISNFELDKNIQSFTIDEKSRVIYGPSMDSEPNILMFKY